MSDDSLVEDYKVTIRENGYNENDFNITTKDGDPPYIKHINVIHIKSNKKKTYNIKNGDIGWDEFEKDIKEGYFL